LWFAFADRRQVVWFARDVGFDQRLRCRPRGDDELSLHAGKLVAGNAAEINEIAGLARPEGDGGAGAFAGNARRFGVLIRKYDVVLGALAIDQREPDDLTFRCGQDRIDLSVDRAADSDIDHAALGDAGAQGEVGVRHISDAGTGRGLWRLIGL
jgi:hypothetical protein